LKFSLFIVLKKGYNNIQSYIFDYNLVNQN
jgi:hypothetical protein